MLRRFLGLSLCGYLEVSAVLVHRLFSDDPLYLDLRKDVVREKFVFESEEEKY